MPFYNLRELSDLGFKRFGRNVLIDNTVQIYGADKITIEDNVRIDGNSILSAGPSGIYFGSHIHIGAGCYLFGNGGRIQFADFSGLSPGVKVFSASDDFIDGWLRGPIVDMTYRKLTCGDVTFSENAVVATGSVISPGVTLGRNCSVCALTLVTKDIEDNAIVSGNPARQIGRRDASRCNDLMQEFRTKWEARYPHQF